jgi:hypothetical protein
MLCKLLIFSAMNLARKMLSLVFLSWIAFVVTASGIKGMVLCIGSDGHISVEAAHQGRCRDTADAHGPEQHALFEVLTGTDSDYCVDVSFASENMRQPMSKARHGKAATGELGNFLSASFTQAPLSAPFGAESLSTPLHAPLRTSPMLLTQRTIILRI